MREFKFRAWWPTIQEIQYFDSIVFLNFEDDVLLYTKSPSEDPHGMDELEDQIIMQYTGLKDKNGKEIYEGDIIFHHHREEEYKLQGVVRYEEQWAGFYFAGNRGMNTNTKYEVLGNIYENPELLTP